MNFDLELLEEIYSTMRSINKENKNYFDSLKNETTLIQNNWTGSASDFFVQQYNSVVNTFDTYVDELEKYASYLETKKNQFEKIENINSDIFSNLSFK